MNPWVMSGQDLSELKINWMCNPNTLSVKIFRNLLLGALLLTTAGCVRMDIDLTINKDSTLSGAMVLAVSDGLLALSPSSGTDLKDSIEKDFGLNVQNTKGLKIEEYRQSGYTGQKIILDHVPLDQFKNQDSQFALNFTKNEDEITVRGQFDLTDSNSELTSSEDMFGADFANTILSSADLRIRITFPVEVVSTTGELSQDKRTVTWRPKFGEKTDFTTTVKLPSKSYLMPVITVSLSALFIIVVLVIMTLSRKRKSNLLSSENDLTNQSEMESRN